MTFQYPVKWCCNTFGKIAQVAQVAANERQLCFLRVYVFNAAYLFHCFILINIAANAINSICRIDNNTSVEQAFANLFNQPRLWVLRMNLN